MEKWERMVYQGIDYGDFYLISNKGNVVNSRNGKKRKLYINDYGYYCFSGTFGTRKNKKTFKVHKAVAETFIENANNEKVVNYIDGNKLNNNVNNLEWCNNDYNMKHASRMGLMCSGTKCHTSKLCENDVLNIRKLYAENPKEYSPTKLAQKYKVHRNAIWQIVTNRTYKFVSSTI